MRAGAGPRADDGAAQTNLALAYAIQGDIANAEARLLDMPTRATGQYNVGMLRMSLGQYADAADAFDLALRQATDPGGGGAAGRAGPRENRGEQGAIDDADDAPTALTLRRRRRPRRCTKPASAAISSPSSC